MVILGTNSFLKNCDELRSDDQFIHLLMGLAGFDIILLTNRNLNKRKCNDKTHSSNSPL